MITKKDILNVQNISMIDIFLLKNDFKPTYLESFRREYKKIIPVDDFEISFEVFLNFTALHDNSYGHIVYTATLKVSTNENENGQVISLLPTNKYVEPELKNTLVIENIKNNLILFDLL